MKMPTVIFVNDRDERLPLDSKFSNCDSLGDLEDQGFAEELVKKYGPQRIKEIHIILDEPVGLEELCLP